MATLKGRCEPDSVITKACGCRLNGLCYCPTAQELGYTMTPWYKVCGAFHELEEHLREKVVKE